MTYEDTYITDLEDELEMANATILHLRALLDTVHDIAFSGRDDKYKISDIRVALKEEYS
jgi:hypothetical protein